MKNDLPSIDYFYPEFPELFDLAIMQAEKEWDSLPMFHQLLIHPYMNGRVKLKSNHKLASTDIWAIYQWYNRTGDRAFANKLYEKPMKEGNEADLALFNLSKYTLECISLRQDQSFILRRDYYIAKRKMGLSWMQGAGQFIGNSETNALSLLGEVASPEQTKRLWNCYKDRLMGLNPILFFIFMKGFEKYGFLDEVRKATLLRLYELAEFRTPTHDNMLLTIVLMIENVIGFQVSDWRRNIDWLIPVTEYMGINGLIYRNNCINALVHQHHDKWVASIKSEKDFSITFNAKNFYRRTYQLPTGKCTIHL